MTLPSHVAVWLVIGTLTFSGISHFVHLDEFRQQILKQRLWPTRLVPFLTLIMAAVETTVGIVGSMSYLGLSLGIPADVALRLASATYAFFGLYLVVLLKYRPTSPCACSRLSDSVSGWIAVRAGVLMGLSIYAGWLSPKVNPSQLGLIEMAFLILAATGLAILLWEFPSAMRHQGAGFQAS